MSEYQKIKFTDGETGEEVEFNVVEQTRINNINYLLVTEDEESDEETAYILKDLSDDVDSEANYELLEDDNEIEYVAKIFAELLDDVDIEK